MAAIPPDATSSSRTIDPERTLREFRHPSKEDVNAMPPTRPEGDWRIQLW